jgi:hypothetical protein
MRRMMLAILAAISLTGSLAACSNPYDPGQRALGGGAIGAAAGAGIGGLAGGGRGALAGGLIGGAVGALGGVATTPTPPPPPPAPAYYR